MKIEDLPNAYGEYVAQDYFAKKLIPFDKDNPIAFDLAENQTSFWTIYRFKDGEIHVGRQDKYIGITESAEIVSI